MRKLLAAFLLVLSVNLALGAYYERPEYYDCYEEKICVYPEMADQNTENEPVVKEGVTWNGTLEINDADFMYRGNFSDSVGNVSFEDVGEDDVLVTWDGVLQVKSDCHYPSFEVDRVESEIYEVDITGREADGWQCPNRKTVKVDYKMSFRTSQSFRLNVLQNNLTETIETEDFTMAGGVPDGVDDSQASEEESERPEDEKVSNDSDSWATEYLRDFIRWIPW